MNLRFPGQYYDQETGTHYNYFRDYNPNIGRYNESDPLGVWGGVNTFVYAEGNPINWIDSYGLVASEGVGGSSGYGTANPYKHCRAIGGGWMKCKEKGSGKGKKKRIPAGYKGEKGESGKIVKDSECFSSPAVDNDGSYTVSPPPPWVIMVVVGGAIIITVGTAGTAGPAAGAGAAAALGAAAVAM